MVNSRGGCLIPRLPPNKDPGHRTCNERFCRRSRRVEGATRLSAESVQLTARSSPLTLTLVFFLFVLSFAPSPLTCCSLTTMSMSALRALRQTSVASSRVLAARAAPRALAFAVARVAPAVASRAFSVSALRLSQGACEFLRFPSLSCAGVVGIDVANEGLWIYSGRRAVAAPR